MTTDLLFTPIKEEPIPLSPSSWNVPEPKWDSNEEQLLEWAAAQAWREYQESKALAEDIVETQKLSEEITQMNAEVRVYLTFPTAWTPEKHAMVIRKINNMNLRVVVHRDKSQQKLPPRLAPKLPVRYVENREVSSVSNGVRKYHVNRKLSF